MKLVHGDDVTVTFADLATLAGVALPNFATSDVVKFTLAETYAGPTFFTKTSADGGVTFTNGSAVGAVVIAHADWEGVTTQRRLYSCPWDLQRTRSGLVVTLLQGVIDVVPDVTP